MLTELVSAVAAAGDAEWALRIATTVETVAGHGPDQVQALTELVAAIATAGDRRRALQLADTVERLTHEIPNPGWQAQALTQLVAAIAVAGDHDRAVRLAREISNPQWRAEVLHRLASQLMTVGVAPSSLDPDERGVIVRRMLAEAIGTPSWQLTLGLVARVDLAAVLRLSDALSAGSAAGR